MSTFRLNRKQIDWMPVIILLLLAGVYAWSFIYSVLVLDSSRDLYRATQISQFQHFPLMGPDIGGMFHTGPLWFYLLSLPAFFGSLKGVALFVGLLAGLKFLFAYQLGRAIVDRRFGLIWALMLLLPGWQVISQVFINHTNLTETLSLLFILVIYRCYQSSDSRYGLVSALVMGLGFHAHPSFLVLVVFYLPLIWQRKINLSIKFLALYALIFIAPLLPYLVSQAMTGWPDWDRMVLHDGLANQIKASGSALNNEVGLWLHWLQNLKAIIYGGPVRIFNFVADVSPLAGALLAGLGLAVALVSVIGLVMILKGLGGFRKHLLFMVMMLLSALFLLTLLRGFTPFYMLLPLTALFHGIWALGFYVAISHMKQQLLYVLFGGFLLIGLLPIWAIQKAGIHDQINFGVVMDVNAEQPDGWIKNNDTLDVLTIQQSRELAEFFCGQSVILNGPLSVVIDVAAAVPMEFFCDEYDLRLGGKAADLSRSVFVMHRSFWQYIEAQPVQWITSSWGSIERHHNSGHMMPIPPAVFDDYVHPPRSEHILKPIETHAIQLQTDQLRYLSVSNLLPFNVQFRVDKITANNTPVELVVANAANHLYHCQTCQEGPINWQLSITSNDIEVIDINAF